MIPDTLRRQPSAPITGPATLRVEVSPTLIRKKSLSSRGFCGAGAVVMDAIHAAARPKTDAALLGQMVTLRCAGKSLRQIGQRTGCCMESVRQALMRYEQARAETPAHYAEEWHEALRSYEPLPPGHPIAVRALWHGLERWMPQQTGHEATATP